MPRTKARVGIGVTTCYPHGTSRSRFRKTIERGATGRVYYVMLISKGSNLGTTALSLYSFEFGFEKVLMFKLSFKHQSCLSMGNRFSKAVCFLQSKPGTLVPYYFSSRSDVWTRDHTFALIRFARARLSPIT
eukprot:1180199-Prorocentrum_minimum.AAC.3